MVLGAQAEEGFVVKSESWVAIECLLLLGAMGIVAFFYTPKYEPGVYIILTALISVLNQSLGTKAGSKMPQQSGDAQEGQSSKRKITTTVDTEAPAGPAAEVQPIEKEKL